MSALCQLAWNLFVIGRCSYLVFWRDHSGWWFVLAVALVASKSND